MITHPRKLRFKVTFKNPLAEKLKEKHESSTIKLHASKNHLKSIESSRSEQE